MATSSLTKAADDLNIIFNPPPPSFKFDLISSIMDSRICLLLLISALLFTFTLSRSQSFIGINYGQVADNLPLPEATTKLLQSTSTSKISPIAVGNEVPDSNNPDLSSQLLPAMQNLQNTLLLNAPHSSSSFPRRHQEVRSKKKKGAELFGLFSIQEQGCTTLGLLISELSEEPWKGRVIMYSDAPQLHKIEGETLKAKARFIRTMESGGYRDLLQVFDQLLQVAALAKLDNEQMVKRVFVFGDSEFNQPEWESAHGFSCRPQFHMCGCWFDSGSDPPCPQTRIRSEESASAAKA